METKVEPEFQSALTTYAKDHAEPAWSLELRQKMLTQYPTLPLPRYEKIDYQKWDLLNATKPVTTISDADLTDDLNIDFAASKNLLVEVGKSVMAAQLDPALAAQGVIFTDIFTAMRDYPELVEKYYMKTAVKADNNRLTAFHAAFMNGGAFLYVPKNVAIKDPIQAYYIQDSTRKQDFVPHVLVIAEEGSELTYHENLSTSGTESNLANIVVEVIAKDNAHVHFSAVDQLSGKTTTYLNRHAILATDATVDWAVGFMNDGNVVGDFSTDLRGKGSHTEVKVVAITTGKQVQGIDTKVTNYGQHTIGHILQHGVILEDSTLTFNGVGHIVKGARGSDAQQESRVLMLSTTARGDADPILLIDENDVTAGHAASVGRVDEGQMYYLMSRGISKKVAERLVIRGFLGSVITEIPSKTVRERLTATIERKLENGQKSESDS
ncbi:Fe-S cluster assembly protein SufD [Loigolactobacillus iwatensis]|uniref:Fe-S cluster assembly protein SufD n=1 Tax=Loigolactobacillus iwatensis TaxID=1267156 RepID=UPI000F7D9B03|nr:Fe-S cluster assembly protein SufD [Loigolactobacillus iwatensis]